MIAQTSVAARVLTRRPKERLRLRTAASTLGASAPARKGVATGLYGWKRQFHEYPTAHRAVATALGCALEQASKAPLLRVSERGVAVPHWQKGFFDHVLRSQESAGEKWKYVRENPVRAGLVGYSSEWRYLGEIFALDYRVERL